MADIFLSYAREDAGKARSIALALERAGHSVWWDLHVRGGAQFAKVIEEALKAADAVVVLWTAVSVESPWVRDEASAGRDTGRLIPVSLDGTEPPLGFRQFHTIDLNGWSGRGKIPRLGDILSGIESKIDRADTVERASSAAPVSQRVRPVHAHYRPWLVAAAAVFLLLLLFVGLSFSRWSAGSDLPVVEVMAADPSPRSALAANDLFVKLGGLPQVGDGKWQLLDSNSVKGKPDLLFRTSDVSSSARSAANLMLLDGKDNSLLWSREFALPAGQQADLKQQVSLTAGRVLGCALESRDEGHLPRDLRKTFLDACASLADLSGDDYGPVTDQLRKLVRRAPKFEPAWTRLIMADSIALEYGKYTPAGPQFHQRLRTDSDAARAIFPNLPELALAQVRLRARADYGRDIDVLSAASDRAPDNASLRAELSNAYAMVGRMGDAISSARRAAELDPLSPGGTTTYIMTLANGGQIETARNELAKAERSWAGTGSLRDAQLAFHVRYGDPEFAAKLDPEGYATASYYAARARPSAQNISAFKAHIDEFRSKTVDPAQVGWAIQGLGEFGLVDDVYYWLGRLTNDQVTNISYLLFRPTLASARRDPRFMPLAKRIGLVDYWQSSGKWPDYCSRPDIPYDCKKEAAKLTA